MEQLDGRHFLQIPGPTNVPDRVLRAMSAPTIDHRGPEFAELAKQVLADLASLCGTSRAVVLYPSSGTGAWEAALVNTLSPGDTVASRLAADRGHRIKAVMVVHHETSTGVTSAIPPIRAAIDEAGHPALLLVDTVSSLGSVDYQHDAWGVDVTIWGSQKGMMLPPGLGMNAVSAKALQSAESARLPRSYWDWRPVLAAATPVSSRTRRRPTCSSGCVRRSPSSARGADSHVHAPPPARGGHQAGGPPPDPAGDVRRRSNCREHLSSVAVTQTIPKRVPE